MSDRRTPRVLGGKPAGDVRITEFELRPSLDEQLFQPPVEESGAKKP